MDKVKPHLINRPEKNEQNRFKGNNDCKLCSQLLIGIPVKVPFVVVDGFTKNYALP